MDSGIAYIIGLLWVFTYVLILHVEVPVIDTGLPSHAELYDSEAQIKNACTKFLRRVD
jgi:hypothetical protein